MARIIKSLAADNTMEKFIKFLKKQRMGELRKSIQRPKTRCGSVQE